MSDITPTPRHITLEEAYALLQGAEALATGARELFLPQLYGLGGNTHKRFAEFEWRDYNNCLYSHSFCATDNESVRLCGSVLTLIDEETKPVSVILLGPLDAETLLYKELNKPE